MDRLDCDRMFVAVGHSFAAAAEPLGTSSGQASKLVSRLEYEVGVLIGFHPVPSSNGFREDLIERTTPDAAAEEDQSNELEPLP